MTLMRIALLSLAILAALPVRGADLTARDRDFLLRSVDGPIAPLPCLSRTAYRRCDDCRSENACELRIAFAKAYTDYLSTLEHLSLAEVMRQSDGAAVSGLSPEPMPAGA